MPTHADANLAPPCPGTTHTHTLCDFVLLFCFESVLLSCSNSPSWPSRSRCLVSVVTHTHTLTDALSWPSRSRCRVSVATHMLLVRALQQKDTITSHHYTLSQRLTAHTPADANLARTLQSKTARMLRHAEEIRQRYLATCAPPAAPTNASISRGHAPGEPHDERVASCQARLADFRHVLAVATRVRLPHTTC